MDEDQETLYGLPIPPMTENIHPLEFVILISGVNMEDGEPTMTSITSKGIAVWNAVGMLRIEAKRLETIAIMNGTVSEDDT